MNTPKYLLGKLKNSVTYLHSALDNIERANNGVSDTAGKDTTSHAFAVVREVVNLRSCHLDAFYKSKRFKVLYMIKYKC